MALNHDFEYSKHTAIISDLHLCEAEPVNPKFPLWKKFKTREFFYDDVLNSFLKHTEFLSGGNPVELILNGDIFDFDGVTSLPEDPLYRIYPVEKSKGLFPRPERSLFKIQKILTDHFEFIQGLREFILNGNRVVFVIGNHDVELHYAIVQNEIIKSLNLSGYYQDQVRFVEWFYISNKDTLVEHGNQYDPYCVCEDPVHPFSSGYNYTFMKLPFGNLACRYILNGLGFFNPHSDANFIMGLSDYIKVFIRYMVRAQPFLILSWFWGSILTLHYSLKDHFTQAFRNPLKIEDRIQEIAMKSNSEPRMVREMKELFATPAIQEPMLILKELWLDRALLILISFFIIFEVMILIRSLFNISFFWAFIPMFAMLPFFLFYSKSVISMVSGYKEPDDRILAMTSAIAKVRRVIYGHTHIPRHEIIGSVEHLNSGCWSPAFKDMECTQPLDQKTFVWISQQPELEHRTAELYKFEDGVSKPFKFLGQGRDAT